MRMLKLEMESLAVETFDTTHAARAERGTVRGRDSATGPEEPDTIAASCGCPPPATGTSCGPTCGWSCGGGCSAATCGEQTCAQTCPNTCFICGPQDPG